MRVGVIDYGVGNLGSVCRSLEELRVSPVLVDRATDLHTVDCMILPGVGNFGDCMDILRTCGWVAALQDEVQGRGKPLLGVCLGMQLLAGYGTEGSEGQASDGIEGLGFVPGRVQHLATLGCRLRIPHVGWNAIEPVAATGLFDGIPAGTDFYFVHSYAFHAADRADVLATTQYDITVTAAVHRGRVWGTQFHPEKSSRAGFRVLRNFLSGEAC